MRALILMALPILAGCEQAANVVGGAIASRKAIAELPYAGDGPDAPPLEERGSRTARTRRGSGGCVRISAT